MVEFRGKEKKKHDLNFTTFIIAIAQMLAYQNIQSVYINMNFKQEMYELE